MHRIMIATFAAGIGAAATIATAADNQAIPPKITAQCQSCHGLTGDSTARTVPRLNGQQAEYLEARLNAFLDPTRQTPEATHAMWDMSSHIGTDTIPAIALYYSRQTPTQPRKGGAMAARGKEIYERGIVKGEPACRSCHGKTGEGHGSIPRIAGQHAGYLTHQLNAFKVTMRYHDPMDHNTRYLSNEQGEALAAYLGNN